MASRRRNVKTHPKPTGDDGPQDTYMPPDRPDRNTGQDEGRVEVVDVFGKQDVTVDTGTGADTGVDHNSAGEGDGRSMASEEGGDAAHSGDRQRASAGNARGSQGRGRGDDRGSGGDGDDADGSYSSRVRRRIARERTLVNRERTLREQTQRELADERTARRAQDERIARLERAQTDIAGNAGVKELEAKIEALRPQIAAAMEGGETAKALDLQEKLSDFKSQLAVLRYDLQQRQKAADSQANNTRQQQGNEGDRTSVVDDPQVKEFANQWWRANRHWANRSVNQAAKDDAITIDKEILADIQAGELDFEPYSEEHFEEVARRLHETYPDLEIQDLDGNPYQFDEQGDEDDMNNDDRGRGDRGNGNRQQQRQGNRSPAPVNRMGHNGRRGPNEVDLARQGKVTLDQDDFATMRTFKMDPNNPNDKRYFAKEKMRSILSGARQQGGNR